MKPILEQDDFARGSYDYFDEKFRELIGHSVVEFKKRNAPKETRDGICLVWEDDNYLLEYCGDYPFYILYEADE